MAARLRHGSTLPCFAAATDRTSAALSDMAGIRETVTAIAPPDCRCGSFGTPTNRHGSTRRTWRGSPRGWDGGPAWRGGRTPHGRWHRGTTRTPDLARGDARRVQRFGRHAKLARSPAILG